MNKLMKQLKLPMDSVDCRYYQDCDAPMCPKDINFGRCLWFPGEPTCRLRDAPDWVTKQKKIARLPSIDPNKYFTLRMLNSINQVDSDLQGIDPEYFGGDRLWLSKRSIKVDKTKSEDGQIKPDSDALPQENVGNYPLF